LLNGGVISSSSFFVIVMAVTPGICVKKEIEIERERDRETE
jgi:hypothetical protein